MTLTAECAVNCIKAAERFCYCRCHGENHGKVRGRTQESVRYVRRRRHRMARDSYLEMTFTPDSALPWGEHAGTPLRELPRPYIEALVREGLRHVGLWSTLRRMLSDGIAA